MDTVGGMAAESAPTLVAPGEPLTGIEIFSTGPVQAGNQDEPELWVDEDLEAIVKNFTALAKRDRPLLIPRVKIGHEAAPDALDWSGLPAYGDVDSLAIEDGRLIADLINVPPLVKAWIDAGLYREVSPEIDGEAADASLLATAIREGIEIKGPVLKAVAFLGSNPPANKDILGLKQPGQYRECTRRLRIRMTRASTNNGKRRYFAEVTTMDPMSLDLAGKISWLREQGYPTGPLEAMTDPAAQEAAVNEAVAFVQSKMQAPAEPPAEASQAPAPGADGRAPAQVVLKYSEAEQKAKDLEERLAKLEAEIKARQDTENRLAETKHFSEARRMATSLAEEGYLSAADLECDSKGEPLPHTELYQLMHASTAKTLTFSEAGKNVTRSDYENHLARIKAKGKRYTYGEKARQASGTADVFKQVRDKVTQQVAARNARPTKTLAEKLGMNRPAWQN